MWLGTSSDTRDLILSGFESGPRSKIPCSQLQFPCPRSSRRSQDPSSRFHVSGQVPDWWFQISGLRSQARSHVLRYWSKIPRLRSQFEGNKKVKSSSFQILVRRSLVSGFRYKGFLALVFGWRFQGLRPRSPITLNEILLESLYNVWIQTHK